MNYTRAIASAERLLERSLELGALQYGEFTLSSGARSSYYFDGRLLTTDGESVELTAGLFLDVLMSCDIHRFGGPAVAAVPIIGGMVLLAHTNGYDLKGYFVRSEAKRYGMGKIVEGHIAMGERVAVWDDAISTGGSLSRAIDAVTDMQARVEVAMTILDRNQGGGDTLKDQSIPLFNIFSSNYEGLVEVDRTALREWFNE